MGGRFTRRVGNVIDRIGNRRLPKGVLKFPPLLKDPALVDFKEIESVRQRFGVSDLFRVHGIAFSTGEKNFVLIGPAGIGKSTFLRQLTSSGKVAPIDDSSIILGRCASGVGFKVIETGLFEQREHVARVSKKLRDAFGFVSPYQRADLSDKAFKRRQKVGGVLLYASEAIGRLSFRPKSRKLFAPKAHALTDIIWVQSPRECIVPRQISGNTISKTTDSAIVEEASRTGVVVKKLDAADPALLKRLERAVFG